MNTLPIPSEAHEPASKSTEYTVVEHPRYRYKHLSPTPSVEAINAFYDEQYYDLVQAGKRGPDIQRLMAGGESANAQRRWQVATLYTDVVDSLAEHAPGRDVVEVGCGTGDLLVHLRERGMQVRGVEIAKAAAEFASERGLDVFHGAFETFAQQADSEASCDALLFMNVLEQTRDPIAIVRACARVLRPGGALIIRSGNEFNPLQEAACESLGKRRWWVSTPDQINYFSFASLGALLGDHGFRVADRYSDFPMEMFLLMGDDYVDTAGVGKQCHERRVRFEMALSAEQRRAIYRRFADADIGRCLYMVVVKEA